MSRIIRCRTTEGHEVEFVADIIGSGAMKDVYFSPDKTYVVAFYKTAQDAAARERLQMITGKYRDGIFSQAGGDYWQNVFCWPVAMVEHEGKLGIVAPTYPAHFFFEFGSQNNDALGIKGREKEGKWFAAANLRQRFIDPRELGTWLGHLKVCILLSRAVRRMHMAGLAHSDLSYKNVLIDPSNGHACVIDVDGLVVPGKYPPDVVGTPDFIAPEVVASTHLPKGDPARKLPSQYTDLHALAVLIYMYLLYRHPLRGCKVHDLDDEVRDEALAMGEKALFIEHPLDESNRIRLSDVKPGELPWADTAQIPYSVTGPYLSPLFERAFITALHNPGQRPSANEWETALVKTADLVQPCRNPQCGQKWYVFDNSTKPCCPFCHTPYDGQLPVLNLYSSRQAGQFRPDNHRLMVWTGQSLFAWHANSRVVANEKLTPEQKQRVGYFVLHGGRWWLVNEGLPGMMDAASKTPIAIGEKIELVDGAQILLDREEGGRLLLVQLVAGD